MGADKDISRQVRTEASWVLIRRADGGLVGLNRNGILNDIYNIPTLINNGGAIVGDDLTSDEVSVLLRHISSNLIVGVNTIRIGDENDN